MKKATIMLSIATFLATTSFLLIIAYTNNIKEEFNDETNAEFLNKKTQGIEIQEKLQTEEKTRPFEDLRNLITIENSKKEETNQESNIDYSEEEITPIIESENQEEFNDETEEITPIIEPEKQEEFNYEPDAEFINKKIQEKLQTEEKTILFENLKSLIPIENSKKEETNQEFNIDYSEQQNKEEITPIIESENQEEIIEITKKEVTPKLLKEMLAKYANDKAITINIPRNTPKIKLKYYARSKIAELLNQDGIEFDANSYLIILSDLPNQEQLNKGNLEWQSGKQGTDRKVNFKIINTKTKQTTIVKSYYRFNIK